MKCTSTSFTNKDFLMQNTKFKTLINFLPQYLNVENAFLSFFSLDFGLCY